MSVKAKNVSDKNLNEKSTNEKNSSEKNSSEKDVPVMKVNFPAWLQYFRSNVNKVDELPWQQSEVLDADERAAIGPSMAAFQLGESSEGRGLLKAAQQFAGARAIAELEQITKLFIKEEQHHAALLKRFMNMHGIALIKHNWTDEIFRKMRKHVNFELTVRVLITAEIISLVYYRALANCTATILLKAICEKILADEYVHVKYEAELLNQLQQEKSLLISTLLQLFQRLLYGGTLLIVFLSHYKVISAGGYRFHQYWQHCWQEFAACFGKAAINRVLVIDGGSEHITGELK